MSTLDVARFQILPADERLTVAMSLFEAFVLSQPKFESLPVSSIDPIVSSQFPIALQRIYEWIGRYAFREKRTEVGPMLPFDSNSIEWAMPGVRLPNSTLASKGRSVIAWIPGGPFHWEVELNQPDSNLVYILDRDHLDEFPDDCDSNPMNLGDFITTFLLSESIRQASLSIRSSYIATKFLNHACSPPPFWIGSQFPNRPVEFFDWDGIMVEKDNDTYCFGADSTKASQLQALRGNLKGFKINFLKRCIPISQSERFEISVDRIPAFEDSGRVTIEVGKFTSYRFWQEFSESLQFDELLSSIAPASGAPWFGSHCFLYDGEDTAQFVRTRRTEGLISFVNSVIERIDPRIQDQCHSIVSSSQNSIADISQCPRAVVTGRQNI